MMKRTQLGLDTIFPKPQHKNLIIWEKWKDPYGENIDDVEWPGYDLPKDEVKEYTDGYESDILELDPIHASTNGEEKQLKNILTPMGMVPLTEYTRPSKIFNFWVGHTNFSITKTIYKCVEKTDGVETLDIFTRYRMKIGIGMCFKPRDVMYKINTTIQQHLDKHKKNNLFTTKANNATTKTSQYFTTK